MSRLEGGREEEEERTSLVLFLTKRHEWTRQLNGRKCEEIRATRELERKREWGEKRVDFHVTEKRLLARTRSILAPLGSLAEGPRGVGTSQCATGRGEREILEDALLGERSRILLCEAFAFKLKKRKKSRQKFRAKNFPLKWEKKLVPKIWQKGVMKWKNKT